MKTLEQHRSAVADAAAEMEKKLEALESPQEGADVEVLQRDFDTAESVHAQACKSYERAEAVSKAKRSLPVAPVEEGSEPDADDRGAGGGNDSVLGIMPSKGAPVRMRATHKWDPDTQRIGGEESIYHSGARVSFVKDQLAAQKGDRNALERILRSGRELAAVGKPMTDKDGNAMDERAISETATAGGELVAPLYLQDNYLKLARAARPYFDLLTSRPLPPNTNSINIPRLVTGTVTEPQKDLGAVKSKDLTTGLLTFPVITVAGQQDFARQLFDRAVPELADMVVFPDLVADYLTKTDVQAISGNGSAPNAKGVLETVPAGHKVTYTSGSPELAALYSKLADAIQRIHTGRYLPPTAVVMHPRRWGWMLAAVDGNKRPLIVPAAGGPFNVIGNLDNVVPEGFVGSIQGLPVYVDPSIPTNLGASTEQDIIIVQRVEDSWTLEDEPVKTRVYEEVLSNELAVRAQVFNYLALTHERYAESICTIGGTGLVTPAF